MRDHLENEGYHVITSENGEEAICALKQYDISLAITDLKMPKVDGFGVIEYIKQHCRFVPIIVLTGYVDVEMAVSTIKKGCFDYITKPIKKNELIEVVGNALKEMRAEQAKRRFKIVEIYLLRDDGFVMFHDKMALHAKIDPEIFGYMLTVIKTLVRNSLGSNGGLGGLEHSDLKVLIEESDGYFLAVIGQGSDIKPVQKIMKKTVEDINQKYGDAIIHFNGNFEAIRNIESTFYGLKHLVIVDGNNN